MFNKRTITYFDPKFFLVSLLITGIGVLCIYSVTASQQTSRLPLYLKQLCWVGLGLIAFFATLVVDYRKLCRYAYVFYGISILLLIAAHFMGRVGLGAQRWIALGPINIQPSEIIKISLLLVLAKEFSTRYSRQGLSLSQLPIPIFLAALPAILILRQPDLGTSLAVLFLFVVMLFLIGLRSRLVIFGTFLSLMLFPFFWHFFWNSLKDYQRNRLLTFMNPTADPLGTGYHIIQSKIAIGSGGVTGQGFLEGTQSQLKFLPMGHTDFIFAVFMEEWGFIGAIVLLGLYLLLMFWGLEAAFKAKDTAGTLIAGGGVGILLFYTAVNIGMNLGIAPVVGLPLPLMSYGGSSMLSTMVILGLIMNVKMRKLALLSPKSNLYR